MVNEDKIKTIFDKIFKLSTADHVEVFFEENKSSTVRFANNDVTQNVTNESVKITIKSAFDNKKAKLIVENPSFDVIRESVKKVEAMARISPPDPEYVPPLEGPISYPEVNGFSENTYNSDIEDYLRIVKKVFNKCEKEGVESAGHISAEIQQYAVANNKGIYGHHKRTAVSLAVTAMTKDSFGWAEWYNEDINKINPDAVTGRAIWKAIIARSPVPFEPGKYTVILEPAAVADLLIFIFWYYNARAADEGRSFMSGKQGKKIAPSNITIYSDPSDDTVPGLPFLNNGLPAPKKVWINEGVAENLIYDRYWAKVKNKEPTGFPTNLIMKGGNTPVKKMIETTDFGLRITHFWYIRVVDPMSLLLTGVTRNSTCLIEKGKRKYSVYNLRFNESPINMLNNVVEMSPPVRVAPRGIQMKVPALKVKNFNFTSRTEF